ncbi:hypothetical protein C8R43DRAFT_1179697 [Mycena crocata]|nr:hypothetical protein C8R43DRAFT_1179697 [Mycena crocata]
MTGTDEHPLSLLTGEAWFNSSIGVKAHRCGFKFLINKSDLPNVVRNVPGLKRTQQNSPFLIRNNNNMDGIAACRAFYGKYPNRTTWESSTTVNAPRTRQGASQGVKSKSIPIAAHPQMILATQVYLRNSSCWPYPCLNRKRSAQTELKVSRDAPQVSEVNDEHCGSPNSSSAATSRSMRFYNTGDLVLACLIFRLTFELSPSALRRPIPILAHFQ